MAEVASSSSDSAVVDGTSEAAVPTGTELTPDGTSIALVELAMRARSLSLALTLS